MSDKLNEQQREAARQEHNQYNREWRKAHPERVKRYNETYFYRLSLRRKGSRESASE